MDYEKLANDRRSVRGYRPDPVPREVIDELIAVATQAPVVDEHPTVALPRHLRPNPWSGSARATPSG